MLASQGVVDEVSVARVDGGFFMQCCTHAPDHRASGLAGGRLHVQNRASSEYAQHAPQSNPTGVDIDRHLGKVAP